MKNDEQKGNQPHPTSQTANPIAPGKVPANNGHETSELGHEVAAETSRKRTVSSRKLEANRRNARKSTGPKTTAGKKRVSRNSTRHGFYSKWLLVQHQDGEESQAEYDELYAGIVEDYQPVGWHEEDLVDKIAAWSWRLRRAIRYESGLIARALAEHSYELQQSKADDLAEPESAPASNPEMDAMTDHLFLPEKEELEKLLRYEAMINRQLNHAIAELERIQARRTGDISPE